LVRDAEQAHAVSVCAAAYGEYEMFLEERLEIDSDDPRRAQAIHGMLEICKGRMRDLAR
jgi:hypothetical protein